MQGEKKDVLSHVNVVGNLKCSEKMCHFVVQNPNFERQSKRVLYYDQLINKSQSWQEKVRE